MASTTRPGPSPRRRAAVLRLAVLCPCLAFQAPANDDCADAIPILEGLTSFITIGATTDGPPHIECQFDGQTYQDIWYVYTASVSGNVTISTCEIASYDTDLVLYDGADCKNLVLLACEDDSAVCAGFTSELTAPVVFGNEYLIRLGGFGPGDVGAGSISVQVQASCPGGPATATLRNVLPNPVSYQANPAVLGGLFEATVDNAMAGQTSSALVAFNAATTVVLSGGQVLLAIDTIGAGEVFTGNGLSPFSTGGGIDRFLAVVPNQPALCGLSLSTQAIQFGSPPFVLSNAQDLFFGNGIGP